ncbi:TraR/DksA C4-type zinc finger protein [Solidesulfovibrio sp.]
MSDFGDEGQVAETLYREGAIAAALPAAPAGIQVVEDGRVVCAECGEPIPAARLGAMPGATRCRACQEDFEG